MERSDLEQWKSREVARLLALVETERRYWQEIVSTLPVCLGILNHQLILVSANRAFRTRFGVRSEDLRSRRLDSILPQPELADRIRQMMASPASSAQVAPLILTTESGDRLRITVQPHRDWDEDISIQALLIIEDLNIEESGETIQTAPAVDPSSQPAPAALPAVVWTAELPSMQFLNVSESAASITGIAAGDWHEPGFWSARFSDIDRDAMTLQYQKAFASGGVHAFEFRLTGNPRWFRETIRIEEGVPARVHGVLSEITERRTLEEHVIQAQRMDALASFCGRAAHDLNNPLMIVSGYGEELLESLPESDPRHNDMVQILTAAKRIEHIAAGLQAFSRKPASSGPGVSFLDLHDLLEAAVERMRATAGPSLTLDLETPPPGILVHADEVALHSLLYEVAAWMSQGEAQTHLSIHAREGAVRDVAFRDHLPPGPYAIIQVENRGADLEGSSPKRPLFETVIPGKDGSELGPALARAYRQVESWGGSAWAAPNNRYVRILLHAQHSAAPATGLSETAEEPKQQEPPPAPPKRVMVVDDEMGIRSLMRKVLLREGYEVLEAGSAQEALESIQDHPVDLLLTDVVMPEVSGRELAERVVELHPSTRVLYVSGFTAETSVETGNFPPGSQLLQKPFTLAALLRKVKEVLA